MKSLPSIEPLGAARPAPGVTRRALVSGAGAALASAPFVLGARAQTFAIAQAGFRVLYMAPVFVAMDKGYFGQRGLTVTFREIDSGALGAAAVLSGDAQVSDLDPKAIGELKSQGKSPLMFYNLVTRVTLDLIVRNDVLARIGTSPSAPVMERAKALKGLTFGITRPGAPTDVYARYFIAKAGLDPRRDVNLVQVGGVAALDAAFRAGRIDAFLLSPPLPQTLERAGIGTILIRNTAGDAPDLTDTAYTTLFTTADYASKNAPALKAYVGGIRDGVKWLTEHPDEAADYLAQKWFSDTSKESLRTSLGVLLPSLSPTGRFTQAAVQKYIDVFGILGEKVDVDTKEGGIWTNSLL